MVRKAGRHHKKRNGIREVRHKVGRAAHKPGRPRAGTRVRIVH